MILTNVVNPMFAYIFANDQHSRVLNKGFYFIKI